MSTETQPIPETKPVNLRLSETVARERVEEKKTAEQLAQAAEAGRKRERDEKDAEHKKTRAHEQSKRERADRSDKALSEALDTLESLQAIVNTSKKEHESDEARATACLRNTERLRAKLLEAERELAAAQQRLDLTMPADPSAIERAAAKAWTEHEAAWSALPKGYKKTHRDRAVRKRAKLAGIAGR